jgi:hypothetical protein
VKKFAAFSTLTVWLRSNSSNTNRSMRTPPSRALDPASAHVSAARQITPAPNG